MEARSHTATPPSPDALVRLLEGTRLSPVWIGLGVAFAWLVIVALVHAVAQITHGPASLPFGAAGFAWTIVVNAALLGFILAGHVHLHANVASDLRTLRSLLALDEGGFERLICAVSSLSTPVRALVTSAGIAGGLSVATLDPSLRDLYSDLPRSDPRYLSFLLQNALFGALGTRLFATEIHMTRAYARLGRQVDIDLFDPSRLLVFARKGLRSVVVWVLISSAFSMFWVLDSAGQANILFPVGVFVLVTMALVAPTRGVHQRIAAAKASELARVSEAIRAERAATLAPRAPGAPPEDARLGNLVQYRQFVQSIREWPFDVSIVARSLLLIILGVGSWLGGAIVERLLGLALD